MSKIDTSSWKKFKISDLFGKAKLGKYHNPETLTADPRGFEYICASNLNNGVNKDLPRVTGDDLSLTASNIIAWGKQCPMFTWHKDACVTSQGMYYIELGELSEQCALFIITLLEHACKGQYGYNNCLIGSKFDEIEISLPVTAVKQPDWDYMQERIAELEQERIAELEQERIAELEQYLVATGLNDYTLTDEDLKTLSLSGFRSNEAGNLPAAAMPCKEMREFRIPAVFDVKNGHNILKSDVVLGSGTRPYVTAGENNNSIAGYVEYDESLLEAGNCIFIGGKTTVFSYQEDSFFSNDSHNLLLYCKDPAGCGKLVSTFMITQLEKALWRYSWNDSISFKKIQKESFMLPIQTDVNGQPVIDKAKTYHPDGFVPDWEYMAAYIRAIEKLVVKDVVDFKDEFISKARLAVAGKEAV